MNCFCYFFLMILIINLIFCCYLRNNVCNNCISKVQYIITSLMSFNDNSFTVGADDTCIFYLTQITATTF